MPDFFSLWLCFCAVILQGSDFVFGQFGTISKSSRPSILQNNRNLGPSKLQNNGYLDMFAQRHYYNTLMGRMMDINNSKMRNTNRNNVNIDEIKEWIFTDPHNLRDAWAPPSGSWQYFGDWKESDRAQLSDVAPAYAARRNNIIKYFFRRGILFNQKRDGTDVPQHPVVHSGPMVSLIDYTCTHLQKW